MQWIRTSQQLPPVNKTVLITGRDIYGDVYTETAELEKHSNTGLTWYIHGGDDFSDYADLNDVPYWMPIPDYPDEV